MRAMISFVVAPVWAAKVPAVGLSSWNFRPDSPAAAAPGFHTRKRKLLLSISCPTVT